MRIEQLLNLRGITLFKRRLQRLRSDRIERRSEELQRLDESLHIAGKRLAFDGKDHTVVDGPFAETKELVAGFSIWKVKDMDEALAWAKRAPMFAGGEVEIRPFYEAEDLGEFVKPEELATVREGDRGKLGVA